MSRYAVPNSQVLNSLIMRNGFTMDLVKTNTCKTYLSRVRKNREMKSKALHKCLKIFDRIHREKCDELQGRELFEWQNKHPHFLQMLKLADVSQLEYLLTKYSSAENPDKLFMKYLKEL